MKKPESKQKIEKYCRTCRSYQGGKCKKEDTRMLPDSWCKNGWKKR